MNTTQTNNEDLTVLGNLETVKHIQKVRRLLYAMIEELDHRAIKHDKSKLEEPEASIFASNTAELAKTTYGTPEYDALKKSVQPAIDHHYANNRHHPEHWPDGVNDMTLIDLLEMLCDWQASTQRVKNGNIRKSVEINAARFGFSPQLRQIFENTVRELFQDNDNQ